MALSFIGIIEGWAADLSTALVVDATVYGGSNPTRDQLAVVLFLYKRDAQSNDTQITIDNTSPLTAVQWSFSLPDADGDFVGIMFGFNIWSAGTYAQNACVFYEVDGNYYIANTSTSQTPGGGEWTLITDIISTCTGNASVQQTQFHLWSSAHSQTGQLGDAMADLGAKIKDGRCKNWEQSGDLINGAAAVESAFVNWRRQNYSEAQEIIDWVQQQTSVTI